MAWQRKNFLEMSCQQAREILKKLNLFKERKFMDINEYSAVVHYGRCKECSQLGLVCITNKKIPAQDCIPIFHALPEKSKAPVPKNGLCAIMAVEILAASLLKGRILDCINTAISEGCSWFSREHFWEILEETIKRDRGLIYTLLGEVRELDISTPESTTQLIIDILKSDIKTGQLSIVGFGGVSIEREIPLLNLTPRHKMQIAAVIKEMFK